MKKLLATLLALVFCILLSASAFALTSNTNSQDKINAINMVNAAKYAESFIKTIYEDSNFESGNVLTIYSENDSISGYCVDILNNNINNGYVIIKFSNNEPVVSEFCVEENAINPYVHIIEESNIQSDDLKYYSIGPNEYHVYAKELNAVYGINKEMVIKEIFNEYKSQVKQYKINTVSVSNISENNNFVYSDLDGWSVISDSYEGTVSAEKTISGAEYIPFYCSADVRFINETYACGVVAICNLMRYYKNNGYWAMDRYFSDMYATIWDLAGTTDQGSTASANIPVAAKSYLESFGYECSYNSLSNYFSSVFLAIADNKPCILSYGADFGGEPGGHGVAVFGYVVTSEYQYLQVADGWNSYLRYINFNGYNYNFRYCWSFDASY